MRQFQKIFFASTTLLLINACGSSGSNDLGNMPVYPPAPAPPFRYELKPTQLFSGAEAGLTCAINENNPAKIRCWGDNSNGQVTGTGTLSESEPVSLIPNIPTIQEYPGHPDMKPLPLTVDHLAIGKTHACASLSDWSVWCWGNNSSGQLDPDLDTNSIHQAKLVGEGFLDFNYVNAIAAGDSYTCAALADDKNNIWCWGKNDTGQVSGNGTVSESLGFTNVSEKSGLPQKSDQVVTALSAGHDFTCAVYDNRENQKITAQTVWCWGNNNSGQVTGKKTSHQKSLSDKTPYPMQATKVSGLPTGKITSLTTGTDHACVSLADGNLWCWGNDQNAQVSGVKDTPAASPGLTLVSGIPKGALTMSAGENFSCAAFKNGDLWCWGDNQHGIVDGAGVEGSDMQRITNVSAINESVVLAAGAHHMCAAFTDGEVSCWGNDTKGQVNGQGIAGKSVESIKPLKLN